MMILSIPLLPFILIEKRTRERRKKEDLPIYEDISKILKQRAINERVGMEAKASEKDLNYYHELLQKGAITQAEYDTKKIALL